jgi:hypothetical protein
LLRRLSLTRWDLGVLIWLALSRLLIILAVYPDRSRMFNGDSFLYEGLALSLLAGEGYTWAPHEPHSDLIRPPGYSAFVFLNYALFGPDPLAPILWNVVFVGLVYLGIRALLAQFGQRAHPAVGAVFALDLGWLLYSKELLTEPLFTVLILGGLLLLVRGASGERPALIVAAGLAVGAGALVKPIALYLPVALVPWLVGWGIRSGWRPGVAAGRALLLVAGLAVCVAPWYVRNAVVHGTPTFTSIQAGNLLGGHAAFVYADVEGLTHLEAHLALNAEVERRVVKRHGSLDAAPYAALEDARSTVAREVIGAYPLRYGRAIIRGVAVTLFDPGRLSLNRTLGRQDVREIGLTNTLARDGLWGTFQRLARDQPAVVFPLLAYLAFLGGVMAVAASGVPLAFRTAPPLAWLCLLVGGYLLVLGGPHGYARFRLYVLPFILVALHFGAVRIGVWWRGRQRGPERAG